MRECSYFLLFEVVPNIRILSTLGVVSYRLQYTEYFAHHFSLGYLCPRNDVALEMSANPDLGSSSLVDSHLFNIHIEKTYSVGQLRISVDEDIVEVKDIRVRKFRADIQQYLRIILDEYPFYVVYELLAS